MFPDPPQPLVRADLCGAALPAYHLLPCLLQVVASGSGVKKPWLFFLGKRGAPAPKEGGRRASAEVGVDMERPDVAAERAAVAQLKDGTGGNVIVCKNLNKVFPSRDGNPPKVAVKSLALAVPRGECFGMLGPNGEPPPNAVERAASAPVLTLLEPGVLRITVISAGGMPQPGPVADVRSGVACRGGQDDEHQHDGGLPAAQHGNGAHRGAGHPHRHDQDLRRHGRLPAARVSAATPSALAVTPAPCAGASCRP